MKSIDLRDFTPEKTAEAAKDISEVSKNILEPLTKIIAGFASSPVTGIPLLAAASETLYKHIPKRLRIPRELATILLSPSAIADTAGLIAGDLAEVAGNIVAPVAAIADLAVTTNFFNRAPSVQEWKDQVLSDQEFLDWVKAITDLGIISTSLSNLIAVQNNITNELIFLRNKLQEQDSPFVPPELREQTRAAIAELELLLSTINFQIETLRIRQTELIIANAQAISTIPPIVIPPPDEPIELGSFK